MNKRFNLPQNFNIYIHIDIYLGSLADHVNHVVFIMLWKTQSYAILDTIHKRANHLYMYPVLCTFMFEASPTISLLWAQRLYTISEKKSWL